jgi:N4-gp56 family major capsid protein
MTVVAVGDPRAIRKYSGLLSADVPRESFWGQSMMSRGPVPKAPIQRLDDLEDSEGDRISYDLRLSFRGQGTEGDDVAEDDAEDLKFATDIVYIDQLRKVGDSGGRMTKKRTMHNLRSLVKEGLTEWFARAFDELLFIYLSGARGSNDDFIWRLNYPGFAGNPITAPDSVHQLYGGDATSFATVSSDDEFDKLLLDKMRTKATLIGGGSVHRPGMQPIKVKGGKKFALVLSPHQTHALRNDTGTTGWFEITKALTQAVGRDSPMYMNAMGEYRDMIINEHKAVIRFSNAGAGADVPAARALMLGRQAGVLAFGNAGEGLPFEWVEEYKDGKNKVLIFGGSMFGVKKTTYKIPTSGETLDFGVIAADTWIDTTLG